MRLDRIAVRYGRREPWVLRDVSLELSQGQFPAPLSKCN